jgi:hypothetical protein
VSAEVVRDSTVPFIENTLTEFLAAKVVATTLDVRVALPDPAGNGRARFDLDIEGRGIGEVVTTQDGLRRWQRALTAHLGANQWTPAPGLSKSWLVYLGPAANPRVVVKAVPALLAELEQLGLTRAHVIHGQPSMRPRLEALGVTRCETVPTALSGAYRLQCQSTFGWASDGDSVLLACDELLAGPAAHKVENLLRLEAQERHVAIVVTPQDWPDVALTLRDTTRLPTRPPAVADLLDGLWIIPFFPSIRAMCWHKGCEWTSTFIEDWTPGSWRWA